MFLEACTEPEVQRIVLLDGPSVLGWDRWREIGAEHGLGLIEATLQAAIDAGAIAEQPVRPLAHVLMGALDEAAMLVARAEDPEAARAEVGRTIDTLLGGAKRRPSGCLAAARRQAARAAAPTGSSCAGDAPRLLLRVHAHVGELHRLARGRRPRPGSSPTPQEELTSTPFLRVVSADRRPRVDLVEALRRRR